MIIDCSDTLICENLRYLRKKREMSRLEQICQALNVPVEELMHTELEDVS